MTQEKATARPCSHNHATNFNWETKAAYDNGQMLCWDCNQMLTPEPLPQSYASLVNERNTLLSEVVQLRVALDQPARTLHALGWTHSRRFEDCELPKCEIARALLGKER